MANPVLLLAPVTLVACTAILSTALMHSDVHHRSENVIDPLTGMLNRKALTTRVTELEQQSLVSGEPIGIVVGDLDHFKEVNDNCGHVTGDAVLKEVAYEIRKELRAFDLAYRLGGEEFLVIVPGADAIRPATGREAAGNARDGQLRRRPAADHELWGQRLTARRGVRRPDVFGEADMALLRPSAPGATRVPGRQAREPAPA